MPLTYIQLENYSNWKEYYWTYQNILAKEYYIPLLEKWDIPLHQKNILDIGCGNGGFTAAFADVGSFATGVEIKQFQWVEHSNVKYIVQDITSNDAYKTIGRNFDLIILRDVIEHIPLINKENFIKSALKFGKSNAKILITFPPFYSPFGIHQQTFLKTFFRKIPYLGLNPLWLLIPLLKLFGENDESIKNLKEMKACKMTIMKFEKIIKNLNLKINNDKSFLIRPSHEIRYGWKTLTYNKMLLPVIRDLFTLGVVYLLEKNNK